MSPCVCLCVCVCIQSCQTRCHPMDNSPRSPRLNIGKLSFKKINKSIKVVLLSSPISQYIILQAPCKHASTLKTMLKKNKYRLCWWPRPLVKNYEEDKLILGISYTKVFMALFSSFGTRFTNSALLILRRKGLDKLIDSKCYSLGHVNLTESLCLWKEVSLNRKILMIHWLCSWCKRE